MQLKKMQILFAANLIRMKKMTKMFKMTPNVWKVLERESHPLGPILQQPIQRMKKVKKMLTETLLEVTNQELKSIARDVYDKAKKKALKAPAKQLAKSSALASLTSLGVGYGSDSDGGDNSDTGDDSDQD